MQIITLYVTTAIVFFGLDLVMLKFALRPVFERYIGAWLLEDVRLGPAAGFYLFYIAGAVWLVALPALKSGLPAQAALGGAVLGALAYGTYEFTNLATLRNWSWHMVAVDLPWGMVLTGFSCWAGVMVTRALSA